MAAEKIEIRPKRNPGKWAVYKAAPTMHGSDNPLLTFIYPGFDCCSCVFESALFRSVEMETKGKAAILAARMSL